MTAQIPFPTFFIIGAGKSGTTSLHEYMAVHPEISMTEPKEPHLLLGRGWEDRVWGYERMFAPGATIRGECSVGYANYPTHPEIADRIADLVPDARLIYLLRDPVDRVIAHYAQEVIARRQRLPLDEAVRPEDPDNYYVAASRYATQIERYLRRFDLERFLVLDQVDLRDRQRDVLSRAFAHVGADPDFWDQSFERKYNARTGNPYNVLLGDQMARFRESRLNQASRRLLPRGARRAVVTAVRSRVGKQVFPEPSPELRARLAAALAPEVERLREITGQRFANWSI